MKKGIPLLEVHNVLSLPSIQSENTPTLTDMIKDALTEELNACRLVHNYALMLS